jgi:hypothetical protein
VRPSWLVLIWFLPSIPSVPQLIRIIPVEVKTGQRQAVCSRQVGYGRFGIPTAGGKPSSGDVLDSNSMICAPCCSGTGEVLRRVWIGICFGALIPNRTRFLPTSRMVISMSSATMIFWSFLRLMISIRYPLYKSFLSLGEIQNPKNTNTFAIQHFNFSSLSGTLGAFLT